MLSFVLIALSILNGVRKRGGDINLAVVTPVTFEITTEMPRKLTKGLAT